VWLLRFQIGVPYFYGGLAKLNADWLQGEPLRAWLAARTDIGPIDAALTNPSVVWTMTYGALVLDLLVVPLLLHRRTRIPAFVAVTGFHLLNAWLFGLFIFPWLMIAATTIFFDPDWPEGLLARWRPRPVARSAARSHAAPSTGARVRPILTASLAIWVLVQLTLPLRHYAIDGSPNWTEQGHHFAWHMKLRDKQGTATFRVGEGSSVVTVDPADHLNDHQLHRLPGHPERLVHFARHLSTLHDGAPVRVDTSVSLNGRRPQAIVDPDVDLTTVPLVSWGRRSWVLSLGEPLRPTALAR
jgi:vitamin K-dependent gamma-carboxylase